MIHARHWSFGKEWNSGKGAPPEFLPIHPGCEARIQQLRSFLPESLDSAAGKAERELLKRVVAINRFTQKQNGECLLVAALGYELRTSPQVVFQERQQFRVDYGHYAALRGVSYLGRGSIDRIMDDYQRGRPWSEIASDNGSSLSELMTWIGDVMRITNDMSRRLRNQLLSPDYRLRP